MALAGFIPYLVNAVYFLILYKQSSSGSDKNWNKFVYFSRNALHAILYKFNACHMHMVLCHIHLTNSQSKIS